MREIIQNIVNFIEHNFTPEGVNISIVIIRIIIIILGFGFGYSFLNNQDLLNSYNNRFNSSLDNISESMKKQKYKKLNYSYIEDNLLRNGITFKFKGINPLKYIIISVGIGLFLAWFLSFINTGLAIIGLIGGLYLFDLYIWYSNKSDNAEMMSDIKTVFTTLKLQTKAGMFITSALTEAFTLVKNPRLKQGILELSGDLVNDKSMAVALDKFNAKFNNNYIDSLVVIIKQSNESGKAAQSFKDIEMQLEEIQSSINLEEKKKIEMQVLFVNMLIYGAIIATVLYSTILSVLNTGLM